MTHYLFFKTIHDQKWYAATRDSFTPHRHKAGLFADDDWIRWALAEGLQREEVKEQAKGE